MSRVAIVGDNSVSYIDILLDVWNQGDSAVLIDSHIPTKAMIDLLIEAQVKVCYIDKNLYCEMDECHNIEFILINSTSAQASFLPISTYQKFRNNYSKNEALIIYSSGTTGKSKGIILSHYAINTNADSIIDYMQLDKSDSIYIAKPLFHSSTITGELLVALKADIPLTIAPTLVPPRYVIDKIKQYNITTICLNPTLLHLYSSYLDTQKIDLPSLRTIYVSGSILYLSVLEKSRKIFKNTSIYNVYGLSEAGPRVSAQCAKYCHSSSVGKPIKGVDIAVINEKGELAQINEYGAIHINSPSLFSGYVSGDIKHHSRYNDWLNSGDIGYIDDFGELNIVGRADDVIIINSHKIYPNDIERQIIKTADVDECVVVKVDNNGMSYLGCLYVGKDNIMSLRRKLKDRLLPYEIPKMFVKCDVLPRNSNGKICIEKVRFYFN